MELEAEIADVLFGHRLFPIICSNRKNATVLSIILNMSNTETGADAREVIEGDAWFMEGDFDHWNSETLTYTEGENSVTVSGVSADQIELVFAFYDTASYAVFDKLIQAGAFEEYSSRTIFDVEPAGYLANA